MAQGADVRHTMATAVCGAVLAVSASAAAQGIRTVTETAEPIPIVTQVRHTTTVVLPATETIVDVVAGDGEYWDVSASANVAYVKPLDTDAASNVTLVAESGRVWALVAVRAEQAAIAAAWLGEYPGRVQFPYRLEARARLEPFLVEGMWHDGRFTYLRSRAQETPALFELTDGDPALVAYDLYDDGLYVADHVLGPGRLVVGERWTEWGDRRPRPRQPWSMRRRVGTAAAMIGSAVAVFWVAGR